MLNKVLVVQRSEQLTPSGDVSENFLKEMIFVISLKRLTTVRQARA